MAAADLEVLRTAVARLERGAGHPGWPVLPTGVAVIDAKIPGNGLALGALHEVAGRGAEAEHGAAATLLVAGLLAGLPAARLGAGPGRAHGTVLWASERGDLFPPALAAVGLHPDRVVFARCGKSVLAVMEEALRHPGLAAVVGELGGRLDLTASRRLQLAAEASGAIAFVLRRTPRHDADALAEPCAALTRWRVAALPSPPVLPLAPDVPGVGRRHWHLELLRARGGIPSSWTVEACDAQGHLHLAAEPGDRQAASRPGRAAPPGAAGAVAALRLVG